MNPKIPNTFQSAVLTRAMTLNGQHHRGRQIPLNNQPQERSVTAIREAAHALGVEQCAITRALNEPVVHAPHIGQAGPLAVERYTKQPPCHVHRAAEAYLTTKEAMEVGAPIPNGFILANTYDTTKFGYDWTELTMWSLTGLQCTITPVEPEGVIVSLQANMTAERIAAIGGAIATAAAVTPTLIMLDVHNALVPLLGAGNHLVMIAIGLAIGSLVGMVLGRLWWKEESNTRAKVLTRAVQGIVATAEEGSQQLIAPTTTHPDTGQGLPPGLGESAETLDDALEALQEHRRHHNLDHP